MASGDDGGNIKIWNLASKELIFDCQLHSSGVSGLVFSSNDQLLISSGWDRNINVMTSSVSKLPELKTTYTHHNGGMIESEPKLSLLKSVVEPESFYFEQESSTISFQDIQLTGEDLKKFLKKSSQDQANRRQEERSKERMRMRFVSLEIQKNREERLKQEQFQREQKQKEEKARNEKEYQERRDRAVRERLAREQEEARQREMLEANKQPEKSFWDDFFSGDDRNHSSSSKETHVKGYQRKDGTKVKGHNRKQSK